MAIMRSSKVEDGATLSDYEKLRMEKIKRNEDRLKELGLFRTKDALAASARKKKTTRNPAPVSPDSDLPQRRSSRKRKTVVDYRDELVIPMHEDDEVKAKEEDDSDSSDESGSNNNNGEEDEEDDYQASDDDNDDDDEEVEEERPKKRSRSNNPRPSRVSSSSSSDSAVAKPKPKKTAVDTSFDCVNPMGGLTLEYAKTGRSTCRKCKNKIEKGSPRVGMEAWIVGRNCVTWQEPKCLLQNLCCVYEKSGKGKCKASHKSFAKGQLKIGIRCHTATSYYRVEIIAGVLANVVALMRSEDEISRDNDTFEVTVDDIDGYEKLSEDDRQTLESVLEAVFRGKNPVPDEPKSSVNHNGSKEIAVKNESIAAAAAAAAKPNNEKRAEPKKEKEQPKAGAKTNAKGRVEWKFAGHTCYGTLIAGKETKTHCYARTHKGNVKTLAKGKDYWSMLE